MAMNDNLLNVSQNFFTPDIVDKISAVIGQSTDKTKTGLRSVIPAFMSGIVDKGSTPEGAATLVDMVKSHNFQIENAPDANNLHQGDEVVKNVFGSNLNNVISRLGISTGLSSASVAKLLSLVAPVFMGLIDSKVKTEKLNSSGLMNFLNQQKKTITGFSASGFSSLSRFDEGMVDTESAKGFHTKLTQEIPWRKVALAALILLGLWFWWLGTHQKTTTPIMTSTIPIPIQMNMTNRNTPNIDSLNTFMSQATPIELPKHFRFEKLKFIAGKSILLTGGEIELDKIAATMKMYPMSMARLEAFSSNVGTPETNRKLTSDMALAVKEQLVARGIEEERISTAGFGDENPIASNAVAEGRVKNQRVEFVITNVK